MFFASRTYHMRDVGVAHKCLLGIGSPLSKFVNQQ